MEKMTLRRKHKHRKDVTGLRVNDNKGWSFRFMRRVGCMISEARIRKTKRKGNCPSKIWTVMVVSGLMIRDRKIKSFDRL